MKKHLLIIALLFFFGKGFSQKEKIEDYVVTEENDTIFGSIQIKKNYSGKIKIISQGKKLSFSKKEISVMKISDATYVKSEVSAWAEGFFKKTFEGSVNAYTFGKHVYFWKYDSDVNGGRLKPALKLYCDDYPDLSKCLDTINKKNVASFMVEYDKWKKLNPSSKSFYEMNMHKKPILNFKLSFFLSGAGVEIGLGKYFTINSMLKSEFGYRQNSFFAKPFIDTQLRCYYDQDRREREKKKTYKYSGNYMAVIHTWSPQGSSSSSYNYNIVGIEHGWQRTYGKHWYDNVGIGAAYGIEDGRYRLLYDIDLGYNF